MASMATTMGMSMGMTVTSHLSTSSRLLAFQPNLIPTKRPTKTFSISNNPKTTVTACTVTACTVTAAAPSPQSPINDDDTVNLSGSTRTITTLFGIAALCIKAFVNILPPPELCLSIGTSSSSLFFAAMRKSTQSSLNTPLAVVAAGLKKWLDIYSGVLLVRVLLSWFPNIPWERQPLSAIRDLCDPYLSLFRNVVPPVFDTLDISPLLAFAVLGTLASLLTVPV
ncbi:ylmG homolog protein 1-2, chloroplastic-like [Vicia villosa]|uniref:ylmG homolog protein 1-2, chloroplastic-like n=1 Tax=Vicia villosa TaxID=3911 RepID=UPI00273AB167|nr:ylmG homolog protein 1-2, chloroplastic-like [Vicia villosa]